MTRQVRSRLNRLVRPLVPANDSVIRKNALRAPCGGVDASSTVSARVLRLWALHALWILGLTCVMRASVVEAQGMSFDLDETTSEETDKKAEEGGEAESSDLGDDFIADLAAEDEAKGAGATKAPRSTESVEEIYAVQQVYALRLNRLELLPSVAVTMNDPYVSHTGLGLGLNYWFTNVLAVGANFLWYEGLQNESDLNFFARRSTRVAIPISEWQLGAQVNFTYVPFYGKFSMFNKYIFQWDAYAVGGVGLMRTRPIPVIDAAVRNFDYDLRLAFNVGIGLRIFLTRYLAIFTEFRNYMFLEKHENSQVALGNARFDESTWLQEGSTFTNNMSAHIGVSIFFPFTFEYRRPK